MSKYVPPARLRSQVSDTDHESDAYQRLKWHELCKNINGLVNKVSRSNIRETVVEFFKLNLIRGKGPFVRSVLKSQKVSLSYTPVFACLLAVINSKIPEIGELLVTRLVLQFRRAYKSRDKELCEHSVVFIAHLCNQYVAHEILLLQIAHLFLEKPTSWDVELCVKFMKSCGMHLQEVSKTANNTVFERLRHVLQEGAVDSKVQYMIEELFAVRRDGFKGYERVEEDLDLVEEEDQVTHMVSLDEELDAEEVLDVYRYDENYAENEKKYNEIKQEIIGDDDEEDEEEEEEEEKEEKITDMTDTELANFQKTVYLTIMSSMNSEEAVHKLLKLKLVNQNKDDKLIDMVVRCCAQEKTYSKYYGKIGERLCSLNRHWAQRFAEQFEVYYNRVDTMETNQIRNVAKFWGHLLASDKLGWECLLCVRLTEDETTSASRIFVKFMFQEMVEEMTVVGLKERLAENYIQPYISGMFPHIADDVEHLRFAINFFTAIGLGVVTESMRSILLEIPSDAGSDIEDEEVERRGRGMERSGSRSGSEYSRSRSYSRSVSRSDEDGERNKRRRVD